MTPLRIGAALPAIRIARNRDWLLDGHRDLEIQDFTVPEILDGDWVGVARFIREALDGYEGRLGIHGPYDGLAIASRDPLIRQVVAKRMDQGLDAAAAIGATQMVVHSPFTTWEHFNHGSKPAAREQVIEQALMTMRPAVKRAEDQGVTLVLENIEDVDPAVRVDLAARFESQAVKVSLDTGHALFAHGSTGGPPVDYYVRAAGNRLEHVHLQDADGHADRHWVIGEGIIKWEAVLRAIAEEAPKARMILELNDYSGIPASWEFLKATGLAT
ncbi:MAG: sugar phosphate isomerase/epimerase [Paracoccaceae bacterium]|jgi:sugar phosphate isomerase/epimerase|nr:sugar phosphate isomerase/epimerase [Paracoccaceae bacterium]